MPDPIGPSSSTTTPGPVRSATKPLAADAPPAVPEQQPTAPAARRDTIGTGPISLGVPEGGPLDLGGLTDLDGGLSTVYSPPDPAIHKGDAPPLPTEALHDGVASAPGPKGGFGKTLAGAGAGAGVAVGVDLTHTELQFGKKGHETLLKIKDGIDKWRKIRKEGVPEPAPTSAGPKPLISPLSKPLTPLLKAFEVAKVAKGLDGGFSLYFDARTLAKDAKTGDFTKVGLDVTKTLGDGLGVVSGAEGVLKLAGKQVSILAPEVSVFGQAAKKIPVLGVVGAGLDAVSKSAELYRGVDPSGKPLTTSKRVGDTASLVADAAILVATVTPPPIDVAAGLVAAGASLVQLGADQWDTIKAYKGPVLEGAKHFLSKAISFF